MSAYEAIGGADAVAVAVEQFYQRVLGDAELAPYFDGVDISQLKEHQRSFISVALGGPETYLGHTMSVAHAGLDITGDHFDKVVGHLVLTLDSLGIDQEVIGKIGAKLRPLKGEIVSG